MRVLEGDLQLVSISLQRAQEVLREPAWKDMGVRGGWGGKGGLGGQGAGPDSPSSSLLKVRLVVSSFRFLLKSMLSLLSFFLMLLISCCRENQSDSSSPPPLHPPQLDRV